MICEGFNYRSALDKIADAYIQDSEQDFEYGFRKIENDLTCKEITGKCTIGGGALGILFAVPFFSIPVVGPLMSVILVIAGVAAIIFGRDLIVLANNLKNYSKIESLSIQKAKNQEPDQFMDDVANKGVKNTLILSTFLSYLSSRKQEK